MSEKNTIKCPNCGKEINVSDVLYHQIQASLEEQHANDVQKLAVEREKFEQEQLDFRNKVKLEVDDKLKSEKAKVTEEISRKLKDEMGEQFKILQDELNEKTIQVKDLNKLKAEKLKLISEKDTLRSEIELEKAKEYNALLAKEKAKISEQAEESSRLQIEALKKQLNDQKNLAAEMKRKAEQGSQQLQGEIQELAMEDALELLFPMDEILEVPKGVKGADVIQIVNNKLGIECGKIIYESKRTKSFSNDWIKKLKTDAVQVKADLCIIVTETMPDGMDKIGLREGVWICSFVEMKSLVMVLRENLIKISEVIASQTNKGDKMQMLYDYLTGNEFALQVGAIVDGFNELQLGYLKERHSMELIWKKREKQLEKVLLNTNHFIGSVKGIASIQVNEVKQLSSEEKILELLE